MSSRVTMWTWQDAVEQLLDQWDHVVTDRSRRLARQATMRAYSDMANFARWTYYDKRDILTTSAKYVTGTVAYDHTGGTYERELTLSSGTWPSDADFGKVIISDVHYDIATRESDTVVTLTTESNPGSDVASGTTYTWYRSSYPLPIDFRRIGRVFDVDNEHEIALVGRDVHHAASVHFYDTPDTPWQAAITNNGDYYNSLSLEFGPPPSTARTYDYIYEREPRPLEIEKYETGTVTISANTAALTGSGTTFPSTCVGSVIRLSADSSNAPTSPIGSPLPDGGGTDNFYSEQKTIIARASATALTLDSGVSSTHSGVKYTISDPLDMEFGAMYTAFYDLASAYFATFISDKRANDMMARAMISVRRAIESDERSAYAKGGVRYSRFSRVTVSTSA